MLADVVCVLVVDLLFDSLSSSLLDIAALRFNHALGCGESLVT